MKNIPTFENFINESKLTSINESVNEATQVQKDYASKIHNQIEGDDKYKILDAINRNQKDFNPLTVNIATGYAGTSGMEHRLDRLKTLSPTKLKLILAELTSITESVNEGYLSPKDANKLRIGSVIKTKAETYTIIAYGQKTNATRDLAAENEKGDKFNLRVSLRGAAGISVASGNSLNFNETPEMLESLQIDEALAAATPSKLEVREPLTRAVQLKLIKDAKGGILKMMAASNGESHFWNPKTKEYVAFTKTYNGKGEYWHSAGIDGGGNLMESAINEGDIPMPDGVKEFAADEKSSGKKAEIYLATFDGKTIKAQSTNKTWEDGVPVTKYFTRNGYKDYKIKGQYYIIEGDIFWYFRVGQNWFAVKRANYGTPPFEY